MIYQNSLSNEDYKELIGIAKQFHQESFYKDEPFDEVKFGGLLTKCKTYPNNISIFYYKKDNKIIGGILGYITTRYFSNEKIAGDYGMFLLPEYRNGTIFVRLLKAYEQWAKDQKASKIMLGHSTKINMEKAPNFYKKLGYDLQGYLFSKEIK
jgi:GNAT superfamily N-acetyltransferase